MKLQLLTSAVVGLASVISVQGTTVEYGLNWDSSTQTGEYHYVIHNDSLSVPLSNFTIYFPDLTFPGPSSDYSNLSVVLSPAGWDLIVIEPSAPGNSGFADGLAFAGNELAPGDWLAGFAVAFKYTGSGTPGSQYFEIYDENFDLIDFGTTVPSTPVPEPVSTAGGLLAAVGLLDLLRRRRAGGLMQ